MWFEVHGVGLLVFLSVFVCVQMHAYEGTGVSSILFPSLPAVVNPTSRNPELNCPALTCFQLRIIELSLWEQLETPANVVWGGASGPLGSERPVLSWAKGWLGCRALAAFQSYRGPSLEDRG